MKIKILITKDALLKDSLRDYNADSYFDTPNISKLSKTGTILYNHYTTAPSTAMSFTSMITSKFPYEFGRTRYNKVKSYNESTLFANAKSKGFNSFLFLPNNWIDFVQLIDVFEGAKIIYYNHGLDSINEIILKLLIQNTSTVDCFFWIHLPHVIKPRQGYNSDIDLFDDFVGLLNEQYSDAEFYISSDHGHMNLNKNLIAYGFDLYQPAINIPFITNKKLNYVNLTSNVDLDKIIFEGYLPIREMIISETAYRFQAHRKIAIINCNYKLIFNKMNKKFTLYDYVFDKSENRNLLVHKKFDFMRGKFYNLQDVNYYPHKDLALLNYAKLKSEFHRIYQDDPYITELFLKIEFYSKKIVLSLLNIIITTKKNIIESLKFR